MPIPSRGLNSIRTHSGRVDQAALPYRAYMQVTCLEMEKTRRVRERASAAERIARIDVRLQEIEAAKKELLQAAVATGTSGPGRLPGLEVKPSTRRSVGGFKIRY